MSPPSLQRALESLYGRPAPPSEVTKLRGDASTRSYYRVRIDEPAAGRPDALIVMVVNADQAEQAEEAREEISWQ